MSKKSTFFPKFPQKTSHDELRLTSSAVDPDDMAVVSLFRLAQRVYFLTFLHEYFDKITCIFRGNML